SQDPARGRELRVATAAPENCSGIHGLHLRETAIDKQFRARDVAAVVGCEKHHALGDLIGCAEPAERNTVGKHLQAFLTGFRGSVKYSLSKRCARRRIT